MNQAIANREVIVTTDTVTAAIREYLAISDANHFTTLDIAMHMRCGEYPVRAAFTWLTRFRVIEIVPGVRSRRYLGQPADPAKRRHSNSYYASVYQLRCTSGGEIDFKVLMGAFCRG